MEVVLRKAVTDCVLSRILSFTILPLNPLLELVPRYMYPELSMIAERTEPSSGFRGTAPTRENVERSIVRIFAGEMSVPKYAKPLVVSMTAGVEIPGTASASTRVKSDSLTSTILPLVIVPPPVGKSTVPK